MFTHWLGNVLRRHSTDSCLWNKVLDRDDILSDSERDTAPDGSEMCMIQS